MTEKLNILKGNWRQIFPLFLFYQYILFELKNPKWANKKHFVQKQIFYEFFSMLNWRPFWKRSDPGHVMWYVTRV